MWLGDKMRQAWFLYDGYDVSIYPFVMFGTHQNRWHIIAAWTIKGLRVSQLWCKDATCQGVDEKELARHVRKQHPDWSCCALAKNCLLCDFLPFSKKWNASHIKHVKAPTVTCRSEIENMSHSLTQNGLYFTATEIPFSQDSSGIFWMILCNILQTIHQNYVSIVSTDTVQ